MHVDMKGKMVPFAGYELPVLYEHEGGGVMSETLHCRAPGKASVFDVSHMGQIRWTGKDASDFLEKCVVGDIKGLKEGEGRLTLITNATGGIVDDTVVSEVTNPRKDHRLLSVCPRRWLTRMQLVHDETDQRAAFWILRTAPAAGTGSSNVFSLKIRTKHTHTHAVSGT